jgi:hypothetical protein
LIKFKELFIDYSTTFKMNLLGKKAAERERGMNFNVKVALLMRDPSLSPASIVRRFWTMQEGGGTIL